MANNSHSDVINSASSSIVVEAGAADAIYIWLNRPERLNALGMEMVLTLTKAINDAVAAGARAIVLRARGRGFCAGADLKERRTMAEADRHAHNRAINSAVDALAAAPVPTIAVINGVAMGGGLELALGCDIRIASESAQIGLTETRIGAIPGAGGTQRLPRLVGISRALEMMFSGEPVSGRRAAQIGLVNFCVSDDKLDEAVMGYVGVIGQRSSFAIRALKKAVYDGMEMNLSDGLNCERQALTMIFGSADYAEGLAAFAEKRKPKFSS